MVSLHRRAEELRYLSRKPRPAAHAARSYALRLCVSALGHRRSPCALLGVFGHNTLHALDHRRKHLVRLGYRAERPVCGDSKWLRLVAHGELDETLVHLLAEEQSDEIGRASCRERV